MDAFSKLLYSPMIMMTRSPKVLVGMSGGVDSSLSAALLLEEGYEVIGAFMKNWSGSTKVSKDGEEFVECDWRTERRDAMRVAAQLGIPFLTFDFEEQFRKNVVDYMIREYAAGRTPNPDVMCNKFMKFDLFVKEADKLGCEYVATGHYARVDGGAPHFAKASRGRQWPLLLAGSDPNKDQSYFLCQMPREVLKRVLFPVGEMLKSDVREEAKARGLVVADKKDSQGVCFIGEINMTQFLQEHIQETPGNIILMSLNDVKKRVVGQHRGLAFYTIGQRQGLNIGGLASPYYVVGKRPETNELVVSSNFHDALYRDQLTATQMNWLVDSAGHPTSPRLPGAGSGPAYTCEARIRYRQPLERCAVTVDGDKLLVTFDKPQRAVTPGQFIVFYEHDVVLGGGVIE